MEEFDEDDFSDLYADVEVQASSALSAMQRSTKLPLRSGSIIANATRGEKKVVYGLSGAQLDGGNRKLDERDAACQEAVEGKGGGSGGGLRNLPVDNGDGCGSESERENEASSDSDSDDGNDRKVDENYESEKYDDRESDVELGEIAGKDKSLNGDGFAQSKYNTLNSQKMRVDERAQEKRRTFKKGDADDRHPFFSRACEDNQPNYGRKHGGPGIASERHTQASDPVTLDLDEPGSVQISDSVEDSPHEVSGSDLEGMSETSDDRNRRQESCIYNKASPTIEPESSESSKSQHGRGYSCSHSQAAHGSRYFKNSSKRSPSSLRCESEEPISHEICSRKDAENRCVKRGTRDGRYHVRWRDSMREHSNQPKKSNYMFKNRPDEDASYAIDAKHLYNRHANRGKQRAMVTFDYNENDIPYCSQSERILTYSGVRFPDHHLGPAFLKNQYWNVPNCRYRVVRPDCHNMRERQDFLDNKSSRIGYEALEYNRYHNHRRHHFQGDVNVKGSSNLSPKYSTAVNQRSTQFMHKEDTLHHRRRTRRDCLSPLREYDDRSLEGKHRGIFPSSVGDRDHLVSSCDRNVARYRREVEISGRDKRRRHNPLNSLENLCYIETEVDDRRNIRHPHSSFYYSKEPYASSQGGFIGASGPKSVVAHRNIRSSWKEMRIERDQYGTDVFVARKSMRYHPSEDYHIRRSDYRQSSNTSVMGRSISDDRYHDHFVERRHGQHSEVLQPREDILKCRQQDNTVFGSEEPSYIYKRISKNIEADGRLQLSRVKELRERETVVQNSSMLGEEDNNELFDGYPKSAQHHSHAQMHPRHQYLIDHMVIEGRKCTLQSSIRRTTGAGEDTFYGRRDLMECNDKQTNSFKDLDKSNPEKTAPSDEGKVRDIKHHNKLSENQQNEVLDIEEGQIITEELQKAKKCTPTSEAAADGNGVTERLDDKKIQEIMKKMERRRERFKEQISTSRDCEKPFSPLPDSNSGTAEARLERPARKRKWV